MKNTKKQKQKKNSNNILTMKEKKKINKKKLSNLLSKLINFQNYVLLLENIHYPSEAS